MLSDNEASRDRKQLKDSGGSSPDRSASKATASCTGMLHFVQHDTVLTFE